MSSEASILHMKIAAELRAVSVLQSARSTYTPQELKLFFPNCLASLKDRLLDNDSTTAFYGHSKILVTMI
jgi:hypothetical protein